MAAAGWREITSEVEVSGNNIANNDLLASYTISYTACYFQGTMYVFCIKSTVENSAIFYLSVCISRR